MDNGAPHCIAFGGLRVDDAIENVLLTVVGPGAIAAAIAAEKEAGQRRNQVRETLGRDLEAARYAADRAFRQYAPMWRRSRPRSRHMMQPGPLPPSMLALALALLASNLKTVWFATATDARLKKASCAPSSMRWWPMSTTQPSR
jgi:hypothetical protein